MHFLRVPAHLRLVSRQWCPVCLLLLPACGDTAFAKLEYNLLAQMKLEEPSDKNPHLCAPVTTVPQEGGSKGRAYRDGSLLSPMESFNLSVF